MLRQLPKFHSDQLIVGLETSDDAAVYKLNDQQAMIQTLDFFTPIVDDPYMFGQIAAANALSDVYAMGGVPTVAMNIVGFPSCEDMDILTKILQGGADKVIEAGALLVGGHTIDDKEPKYGLSVSGLVHPDKVLANSGAKAGDVLVLTKAIGSGILNTAIQADLIEDDQLEEVTKTMAMLNKYAAEGMMQCQVNGCTDITGFGLIGHTIEVAEASKVTIEINASAVPVMAGALDHASMGLVPAGAYRNKKYFTDRVDINGDIDETMVDVLYDPQTSGGLLISLPEDQAEKLIQIYEDSLEVPFAIVGKVTAKGDKALIVRP